jgi:hypothetical protein
MLAWGSWLNLSDNKENFIVKSIISSSRSRQFLLGIASLLLLSSTNAAAGNPAAKRGTQVVRLGREFKLRPRQQVTLQGESLQITFVEVKDDSRCPADVTCVWAGNAAVRLEVSWRGRARKSLRLNTSGSPSLVGENQYRGYQVKLVGLSPYPRSDRSIAPRDYVATLLVSKE